MSKKKVIKKKVAKKKVAQKKKTAQKKKPKSAHMKAVSKRKSGGTANTSTSFPNTPQEDIDRDVERFIDNHNSDILNLEIFISAVQDNGNEIKFVDGSNGKEILSWNRETNVWEINKDDGAFNKHWVGIVKKLLKKVKAVNDLRHFHATDVRQAETIKSKKIAWLVRCLDLSKISAVKRLAMVERSLKIKPDQLDNHPMIVAVKNGYIDLETQKLIKPDKSLFITKMMDVTYDKDAKAPKFEEFMSQIFLSKCNEDEQLRTDEDIIIFILKWFGYAMTGRTSEHTLLNLYGKKGTNGKSVLWGTISKIFGDYFRVVKNDIILKKGRGGDESKASPLTASLKGQRLIVLTEPSGGDRLDDNAVKDLVSSDMVTARQLHRDPIQFYPTHKILISGNCELNLDNPDDAMARRWLLLPMHGWFKHCKDNQLEDKLTTEAEKSGILNLLLKGVKMYLEDVEEFGSIQQPQAIVEASKDYMEQEDIVLQFLKESCNFGEEREASQQILRQVYKVWCDRMGYKAWSTAPLSKRLKRDYGQSAGKNPSRWLGLEVKPELIELGWRNTESDPWMEPDKEPNRNKFTNPIPPDEVHNFPHFRVVDWHKPKAVSEVDFLWWCKYALQNHPDIMKHLKGKLGSYGHKNLLRFIRHKDQRIFTH
jgi:putative DNA primase/helicase